MPVRSPPKLTVMRAAHRERFIGEQIGQHTPPAERERLEFGGKGGAVEEVAEVEQGGGSQDGPSGGTGCPQLNNDQLRPGEDEQGHELCHQRRNAQV
jgi:hypothetical protein